MKKYVTLLMLLIASSLSAQNFFTQNPSALISSNDHSDKITNSLYYNIDIENFKSHLINIGNRQNPGNTVIKLPSPDGELKSYKVFEASVMETSFQNNYPNIRSYAGKGITNPQEIIRFTLTNLGFQAIILNTPKGTQQISPIDASRNLYAVYYNKDLNFEAHNFECTLLEIATSLENTSEISSFNANDGLLRNFRIAISATAEYSAFYNSNLNDVISAMNIAVSNANAVLERDLSVTMTMVDNTSLIFFDSATDPFTNFDNVALIDENQTLIDTNIGDANYDIGHVFNTAGGGIAGLGTSCISTVKAFGVTGDSNPDSTFFDFVFLHELGHQYGSPHTFNGSAGPCGTNISTFTAVEPGSGSTIMAYPGLCAPQNVVPAGDFYYHQISLSTIWNHISGFTACPTDQIPTGNNPPTADAGSDYLIPQGTPYKLNGSSTDSDGTSSHTFTWEQYDFGPQGAPEETTTSGPVVRSREGTTNPVRYIPRLEDLLINPGSQEWEKLVAVNRDLNFRLTVRDNDPLGGQTAFDAMLATVTNSAGPFQVTSQSTQNQIVWTPGSTETITWNVAGTDANGIDEATINILLSTDGGITYDTVLAANTPNDGTEDIIVPDIDATECRIMIEAVNNIFFNINQAFFAIGNYTYDVVCEDYVFDFNITIPENAASYNQIPFQINESIEIEDLNINVNISGAEDNSSITYAFSPPSGSFNELGVYPCPGTTGLNLTFDDEGNPIDCSSLDSGDNVVPVDPLSVVDGQNAQGNWTFWITDVDEDGITSALNSVTLTICSTGLTPTLSDIQNKFVDFSIYPNPSEGQFTIKGLNFNQGNISVEVYDLKGRLILKENLSTMSSDFEKTLNLKRSSSGIYLVKVIQGNSSQIKKLIVQ
jgi:subtilisin-like proprotein convertase family protein